MIHFEDKLWDNESVGRALWTAAVLSEESASLYAQLMTSADDLLVGDGAEIVEEHSSSNKRRRK